MEDETLDTIRHVIQKILTPIVVIIGVLGNLLSVFVLSNRRMRCSTNVYLTALAVADIIFLCFTFSLSLEHYPALHHPKYLFYWTSYGVQHWLCDAFSYTSIYLTVSFTLERYIAVCHPIRGQVLCTVSRAKKVIVGVYVICIIVTLSTAFEWKSKEITTYVPIINNEPCIIKNSTTTLVPDVNATNKEVFGVEHENCTAETIIKGVLTDMGKNPIYRDVFYTLTAVFFNFIPLILLGTFNWFLVAAVHRSNRLRQHMTNAKTDEKSSTSQENKITIILIAVVLLFLILQTPTSLFLIYQSWIQPDEIERKTKNTLYAMGNFFNFFVTINAAFNFILYCVLSDKYRKTVAEMFCKRMKAKKQISTFSTASYRQKTVVTDESTNSTSNDSNENVIRNGKKDIKTPEEIPLNTIVCTTNN